MKTIIDPNSTFRGVAPRPQRDIPQTESKHTPGTWAVGTDPGDGLFKVFAMNCQASICTVNPVMVAHQANARLIAAAPHLLYNLAIVTERLGALMTIADSDDVSDDDRQALLDARDAIASVGTGKARPTFADNLGVVLRDRDEFREALCRLVEWIDAGCDPSEKSMDAARAALINAGGDK